MFSRLTALFLLFFIPTFAIQAQTKLMLWNIHAEGYPVTVALESFAKEVNQGSEGRYQVTLANRGVMGDQPKAVSMLKSGELDMAEFSSGALTDMVPGIKALNLPFLFRDSEHMFRHLDGKLGVGFADKLKAAGFVVLGWYDGGSRSFYCSHKPILTIRDLAQANVRVQQSEVYIEMMRQLEAKAMSVPFKDIFTALKEKKIDCAENNMPAYESNGHHKVAKYVYLSNHVISPEVLVISTKLWDTLTNEDRMLFLRAGQKSALLMRKLWSDRVKLAIEKTKKEGAQFAVMRDYGSTILRLGPLYKKYMSAQDTQNEVTAIISDQY